MAEEGSLLGRKAIEQLGKMHREFTRRMINEQPHRARWQNHKGGNGGHQILFTIESVYCADSYDDWHLVVTADEYTGGCNKVPPGANDDGTYNVYDRPGCNIRTFYVADALIGTNGWATYFYPLTGDCVPKWRLADLCQQPECA